MFGLPSGGELLLIVIVALVLLFLGKLPTAARGAGKAYRRFSDAKAEIDRLKDPRRLLEAAARDHEPGKEEKDASEKPPAEPTA